MFQQFNTNCPRCHSEVSPERLNLNPAVCDHCGHVLSTRETETEKKMVKSYQWAMFITAGVVIFGHLFFSAWGGYTLEVRWLQLFGGDSISTHERMAQICLETFQYDCVEKHYVAMSRQDSSHLLKLGKFQMSRQRYAAAADTLREYVARHEDPNYDAAYLLARSLSESGQIEEASVQFEKIIRANTEILQLTAVQKYVEMLMKHQQWAKAQAIIEEIRKRGEAVQDFMQPQYSEIKQKLGGTQS